MRCLALYFSFSLLVVKCLLINLSCFSYCIYNV
uniref:Uncharacterized protein n=1 Tax=Rhizophora mucronata TaxID=61149 RepID=A0A2P2PWU2_RHIMU